MPQLDFTTYASQIFWLVITFGLLYIIMAKSALPTVRDVLQSRQARISDDLKKAEKLKAEAQDAEADFTSVITAARQKASTLLNDSRIKADKEAEVRNAKLDETFARQAKESEHRIEVIRREANEKMAPITIEVATDIVKKLAGIKVDKSTLTKIAAKHADE